VIFARIPASGFAYKIGVKNMKKVIKREITFPASLMTPFKIERTKPSPRVKKRTGRIMTGMKRMAIFGVN